VQIDIVIEQRFFKCNQNHFWTENAFPYPFWQRYLTEFQQVNIVARVKRVEAPEANWHKVDGDSVSFFELPHYIGLKGFIFSLPSQIKTLLQRRSLSRKVLFRVPSVLALIYRIFAMPFRCEYAAEVVGDPEDTFSKGANSNVLRPMIQFAFIYMLKVQCRNACAISYVTEFSLQKKYPPSNKAFQTHYSSIQLSDSDFYPRDNYHPEQALNIVCIGNLSQPYKGCDFMLNTLASLKQAKFSFTLTWVGGGELLESMREMASELGLKNEVDFVGNVSSREQIRSILDESNVFVLCSRQEGLPRVLIEAMARSLICIATNVGGVCELLKEHFIIERDDIPQLSNKLIEVSKMDEEQRLSVSKQNFEHAQNYREEVLRERRKNLYKHLKGHS